MDQPAPTQTQPAIDGFDAVDRDEELEALYQDSAAIMKNKVGGVEHFNKPKLVMLFFKNCVAKAAGSQQASANCMFCFEKVTSTGSDRFVKHLQKCVLAADDVRQAARNLNDNKKQKRKAKDEQQSLQREEAERRVQLVKKQKMELQQQSIKTSFKVAEALIADKAIAQFFYANGLPFSAADKSIDSYYSDMVRAIQAAPSNYVPPGRKALAGPLLEACFTDMEAKLTQRLQGPLAERFGITYTQDGWDSVDHLPLIVEDGGVVCGAPRGRWPLALRGGGRPWWGAGLFRHIGYLLLETT